MNEWTEEMHYANTWPEKLSVLGKGDEEIETQDVTKAVLKPHAH